MDRFETVRDLIAATLGLARGQITPQTRQADVAEWDSVGHLNLMLALEDTFGVHLEVEDMARLNSVEAMLHFLETACPSS